MAVEDGEHAPSWDLPLEGYARALSRLWGVHWRLHGYPPPVNRLRGQILLELKEDQARAPVLQILLNHAYVHLALAAFHRSETTQERGKVVQDVLSHLLRAIDPVYAGSQQRPEADLAKMAEAFFAEDIDIRIGKVSDESPRRAT